MLYRGYRGQERAGIRITKGVFASEGDGVYIAFTPEMALEFASFGGYVLGVEFNMDNPVIVREKLYILHEADELEEPINKNDSDWLKANKMAFQNATNKSGTNWSKVQEVIGKYLTEVLRSMGYDGVIVDHGKENRWAVVFDPSKVKVLKAERQAYVDREIQIAKKLVNMTR